jgi:hypothetical protein
VHRNKELAAMLERLETERDFLNQVTTGDESLFLNMTLKRRGRERNGTHHISKTEESSHAQIKN